MTLVRIEISQENLRRYNLTLSDVASALRQAAVELPSGAIDTAAGEILLRVDERRDWAEEFAATTIRTTLLAVSSRWPMLPALFRMILKIAIRMHSLMVCRRLGLR